MPYLIDTDVLSKKSSVEKGGNVRRWWVSIDETQLYISVFTAFELQKGVAKKIKEGETELAKTLQIALNEILESFEQRVLSVDADLAKGWGCLAGSDRRLWIDHGLIATAVKHGLILVSCNASDMIGKGVEVINPDRNKIGRWSPSGESLT